MQRHFKANVFFPPPQLRTVSCCFHHLHPISHPADQLPLALSASSSFVPLLHRGFCLSAKWVWWGLAPCPTMLLPAVSIQSDKPLEPNALPPHSSAPRGDEVLPRQSSAWTLVLVSPEAVTELSVVTTVGKCFFFLISGQQFATKFYQQKLPFPVTN